MLACFLFLLLFTVNRLIFPFSVIYFMNVSFMIGIVHVFSHNNQLHFIKGCIVLIKQPILFYEKHISSTSFS